MMTTRDAIDLAWVAVCQGKFPGFLAITVAALSLTACASTGQESGTETTANQTQAAVTAALPQSSKAGNAASYVVKGKRYFVKSDVSGHIENGEASWYGKRFHGRRTSSGERYDMNAMTAAHKNLPIFSLIEVTNLDNGRSAVVRVNDRGPFHSNRVIDLSYAAASQLDMVGKGSAKVKIQVIEPNKPKLEKGLQDMFVAASNKARTDTLQSQGSTQSGETRYVANLDSDMPGLAKAESPQPKNDLKDGDKVSATAALYLQVGAFGNRSSAERLRQELVAEIEESVLVKTDVNDDRTPYQVQVGPILTKDEATDLSRKLAYLGVGKPLLVSR